MSIVDSVQVKIKLDSISFTNPGMGEDQLVRLTFFSEDPLSQMNMNGHVRVTMSDFFSISTSKDKIEELIKERIMARFNSTEEYEQPE